MKGRRDDAFVSVSILLRETRAKSLVVDGRVGWVGM